MRIGSGVHHCSMALTLAIFCALCFALTNGFLDAAQAIATLVSTRGATPGTAIILAALGNLLGALLIGTAVAGTIAGIATVGRTHEVAVAGSAALAATLWNLLMWSRALPSSSGHALVGALAGAAFAAGGATAVRWGGLSGIHPHGVAGTLIALAVSPLLGLGLGAASVAASRAALRRARARVSGPVRGGQWGMSTALSLSHGANDGQKSMGIVAALLLATGHLKTFTVPLWVKCACAGALLLGTSLGGWRVIRTVGRGVYHLTPLDAFSSQTASTAVILTASLSGAPVSTTHVVSSSIVGVGAGRRRFRHVRWTVVRSMGFAWVVTLPASAALGSAAFVVWKALV